MYQTVAGRAHFWDILVLLSTIMLCLRWHPDSLVGRQLDNIDPSESGLNCSVNIWFYLLQTVNTAKTEKHICPLVFICKCDYFLSSILYLLLVLHLILGSTAYPKQLMVMVVVIHQHREITLTTTDNLQMLLCLMGLPTTKHHDDNKSSLVTIKRIYYLFICIYYAYLC